MDLDGVILDSEKWAHDVWKKHIPSHKFHRLWKKCLGMNSADEQVIMSTELGWDIAQYQELQNAVDEVMPYPAPYQTGMTNLLWWLKQNDYPVVIVTSSSLANTHKKLTGKPYNGHGFKHFMCADCIDRIITGDEVSHGKPAPDIYQLALQKLEIQPNQCIVIEDSPNGIQAAWSAGINQVIMVEDTVKVPDDYKFSSVEVTKPPLFYLRNIIRRMSGKMKG